MLRVVPDGVMLAVRAQPGAKKTAITGVYGEGSSAQLKVAIHAPPVEGRANSTLIELLADTLGLARNKVQIVRGELSRSKLFLLHGVTVEEVQSKLSKWLQ
jgi:uncharacterized protein (TIGR00251 family)